MIYYFAYGSNLHPMRLMQRVPKAELIGVAKHPNHRLSFHKKSTDGSSKCNMLNSGSASDLIYGAIYKFKPEYKHQLDRLEGKGFGYTDNQIVLSHDGNEYTCFAYVAQQSHIVDNLRPYHWYKMLVSLGAKYLGLPSSYILSIEAVRSMEDPDPARRAKMEVLIESIIKYR